MTVIRGCFGSVRQRAWSQPTITWCDHFDFLRGRNQGCGSCLSRSGHSVTYLRSVASLSSLSCILQLASVMQPVRENIAESRPCRTCASRLIQRPYFGSLHRVGRYKSALCELHQTHYGIGAVGKPGTADGERTGIEVLFELQLLPVVYPRG